MSHSRPGLISPPPASVWAWTTRENSICSRRGRSRLCSLFMMYATPPLPDCELTRMTASYERPTSYGSIGRYGASQVMSRTLMPCSAACLVQILQTLLDGVLVGAGEGGVDQIARVRMARVDRQVGAVLHRATDLVDVGEVDLGVDALGEQVHAQGDQVHVAGALAVTEQAALDAIAAGHQGQLGRGRRRAAVVVRVQRDGDVLTVIDLAGEPFDQVGVGVGGGHLDRGRQVEDDLATLRRLPDVHHRVADLDRELGLGRR